MPTKTTQLIETQKLEPSKSVVSTGKHGWRRLSFVISKTQDLHPQTIEKIKPVWNSSNYSKHFEYCIQLRRWTECWFIRIPLTPGEITRLRWWWEGHMVSVNTWHRPALIFSSVTTTRLKACLNFQLFLVPFLSLLIAVARYVVRIFISSTALPRYFVLEGKAQRAQ